MASTARTKTPPSTRTDRYLEAERRLWQYYGLQPRERFLDLDAPAARLRILEVGSGEPMLFVHGTVGPSAWASLISELPGYRSIGADGKTTDREAILRSTRRHGASPDYKAKVAAWRLQHPSHGEVALFGDTAILTWVSDAADSRGKVQSCDIFVYRDRHWRAVYSQHVGA